MPSLILSAWAIALGTVFTADMANTNITRA
jgi:hypothetical protein